MIRSPRYVIPPRRFRLHLDWLRVRRRPLLGLAEYVQGRHDRRLPPAGSVVITFDDGYADVATSAAPILSRFGVPATMFIVTGADGKNDWDDRGPVSGREQYWLNREFGFISFDPDQGKNMNRNYISKSMLKTCGIRKSKY